MSVRAPHIASPSTSLLAEAIKAYGKGQMALPSGQALRME